MKKIRGAVLLFITAFIWGGAFVAQDMGLEYVGPFVFTAIRFLMGGIFLFIVSVIVDLVKIKKLHVEYKKEEIKFGKSNTDQSYYQPIGSQVGSMIASNFMQHLHNGAQETIKEIFDNCSFVPNYMTNEELAHVQKLSEQF